MKIHRSHQGEIFGVCRGIEESTGIPARYIRLLLIVAAILFRFWFILALYLAAALFMPLKDSETWNFQDNFEALSRDSRLWFRRELKILRSFSWPQSEKKA